MSARLLESQTLLKYMHFIPCLAAILSTVSNEIFENNSVLFWSSNKKTTLLK